MKLSIILLSVLCLWPTARAGAQPGREAAFVSVNVVPMDTDRVLWNHTVIVQDGVITALGPAASTTVPREALRIEGRGTAYLFPGLADMHTHVLEVGDLLSYAANGVTTLLSMGLAPDAFVKRANDAVDQGDMIGPNIFFSLLIDGSDPIFEDAVSISSPEDARRAVEFASVSGYDFIKVYNRLGASDFAVVVEESRLAGLPVIGHAVRSVGLSDALLQGQVMVAHAEEFFYSTFENQRNASLIPEVVSATLASGAFVTATLSTMEVIAEQWGRPEVVARYMDDVRARDLTPTMQLSWPERDYVRREGSIDRVVEFLRIFVRALHQAGVPLMTGTDSPVIPGSYPGYSLHHDIQTLVDLGLTPYQALVAATRTPGEFIAKYVPSAMPFGVVNVGMKADLLLAADNPLLNVETLRAPLGVMTAGMWHTDEELRAAMEEQRAKFDADLR